jgi:glycosyltransferase involved in cell wall biosynthesis
MSKRILIFSTDDHLVPAGGAEQAFGNITQRLPHMEFDLICAKLRKGVKDFEKVGNINIYRMGFGIPKIDGIVLALFGHFCAYKLMRKHKYDLIWSIMASYGAFAAVRVNKKTGIPFLLTLQEGDSFDYIYNKVKFVRGKFNEIFKSADGIQAISNYLLNWGREMGFTGSEGKVIPNGVAVDAFTKEFSADEIQAKRASFGFKEDAFVLITSSRLEKKNGVKDVVDALALSHPDVCFVICGSGSLESDIREQVKRLGLEARVKFMGFMDPKELPLLLKASDAFIRPSLSEGLGNAFLEAMAARIPTIGTNAGGIPDFLEDGATGFMVGIEDPASIAKAVERIRALPHDEKEAILARAKALVIEQYNWEVISRDMESMFNTLTQA